MRASRLQVAANKQKQSSRTARLAPGSIVQDIYVDRIRWHLHIPHNRAPNEAVANRFQMGLNSFLDNLSVFQLNIQVLVDWNEDAGDSEIILQLNCNLRVVDVEKARSEKLASKRGWLWSSTEKYWKIQGNVLKDVSEDLAMTNLLSYKCFEIGVKKPANNNEVLAAAIRCNRGE